MLLRLVEEIFRETWVVVIINDWRKDGIGFQVFFLFDICDQRLTIKCFIQISDLEKMASVLKFSVFFCLVLISLNWWAVWKNRSNILVASDLQSFWKDFKKFQPTQILSFVFQWDIKLFARGKNVLSYMYTFTNFKAKLIGGIIFLLILYFFD